MRKSLSFVTLALILLFAPAQARLPRGSAGNGSGGGTTFTLASYVNTGTTSNAVQITLGWTGTTPSGETATWSGGGGSATVTGFTVTGPFATFYASTPSAGTYTLSGTGWTTGSIVVSAAVADLSTGINGPTNVMLGQDSYGTGLTAGIASYVARGLAGPATWTLTGTDSAGFTISGNGLLVPVYSGVYGCATTVCNITLNVTDGVTTLTPVAVTVQRPVSGTAVATVNSNTVFDTATANGYLTGQLGYSAAFVTNLSLWLGGTATFSDPSGHFALVGSAQIAVRMADITAYGTYPLTITPSGGSAFVYNVTIAHERDPVLAWQPNGGIYSSTPATNGYGSNRIGTLASSDDQSILTYAYSSNPTGALNSYSYDPYFSRTGYTYLLSSVSAGTLAGTAAVTSTTAKSTSIVFSLPVASGTTLASSNMATTLVSGLDNFQPSAQIQASGLHVPGTTKVADLTFSGLTPNQSLSDITVIDSNAQLTKGVIFFWVDYYPQYTLVWTSATTAELHAWWLSAVNDTTPQVDHVQVTVTNGTGTSLSKVVDITTSWHTCTQGALSVGPSGTWSTGTAMGNAINAAPSTYAGCKVTVLSGIDPMQWHWTPYGGSSYYGYLLAPIILEGDTTQPSQIAMDFNSLALGGNSQGCIVNGGGYDLIVRRLEVFNCLNGGGTGNAGAFYKFNEQPGNFTLQLSYAHNSEMGFEGGDIGTRVYLIDNLFAANGNGPAGSSHNIYVDAVAQLTVTGNYSVDSSAHEMKWRALKATITDNFFLEGLNWYGWASPVQQAQGGVVTFDRNVVMKGVNDNFANNGNIIEPFNEWTVPMWAVNEFHANNNTIINLVVPGQSPPYQPAVGFTQVVGNADPVRGVPFTYDLNTTNFWNLSSGQWAAGSFGGSAPTLGTGNVAVGPYPSTGVALINPLTGVAPVNLPYQTNRHGSIVSASGAYDMVMTVAAGASAGTNITGGLLTGRDWYGVQMTGQSVTSLTSGYSSSVSSNNIQLKVPAGLTNGIEYPQLTITGSGTAPLPGLTFLPLIVGTGG